MTSTIKVGKDARQHGATAFSTCEGAGADPDRCIRCKCIGQIFQNISDVNVILSKFGKILQNNV